MKILEWGKVPEETEYKGKCPRCSTVFSFLQKEAKYHWDSRNGDFLSIICPLRDCGQKITTAVKRGNNG